MNASPVFACQGQTYSLSTDNVAYTEVISNLEGLKRIRPAWRALRMACDDLNPFIQWEWMWHWWRLFGDSGAFVRHKLHIVVMKEAETVNAIFPFVLTTAGKSPFHVSKLHLYGFTGGFVEMKATLIRPGYEAQAAATLIDYLQRNRRLYHWCSLDGIPTDNLFGRILAEEAGREGWLQTPPVPDYILPLPPTWEALKAGLKRNIKQSIRHCYNSLRRDGLDWEFKVASDVAEMPAALSEFFRLHSLRAAMPDTVAHPDYFSTTRRRLFLHRMARDLCRDRRFMVASLLVDGKVVASRILLTTGNCVYLYFSGFDPAWKQYSVMTTLTAECIKMAIAHGYSSLNFSTGTDVSKTRWGPEPLNHFSIRVPSPTLSGRTLFAVRQHLPLRKIVIPEKQLPEELPSNDQGVSSPGS